MILASGLGFDAGGRALVDDIHLEVAPGQLLALVGANGAGKSTLVRVLSGELKPSRGSVELDGKPVWGFKLDTLARRRAVLSQTVARPVLTVREVVALGRTPHRCSVSEDAAAVAFALDDNGVAPWADRLFPTLSGGEAQRVHLARVHAQLLGDDPSSRYCFLDEPASAMDVGRQLELMERLRRWVGLGWGVVVVVHDLNLAARFADRMAVLREGRLIACGTPRDILNEALVEEAFRTRAAVVPHPVLGHPLVLPLAALAVL